MSDIQALRNMLQEALAMIDAVLMTEYDPLEVEDLKKRASAHLPQHSVTEAAHDVFLRPCPFCGKALEVSARRYNPHARCLTEHCKGAQLPLLNIELPEDVERWNTRAAPGGVGCLPANSPAVPEQQLVYSGEFEPPKSLDVGRYGDMSTTAHLRVGLDGDSDAYVSVSDDEGGASIEFCVPGIGGGKSPHTRKALIALMVAIEHDNAADPARDWWARSSSLGDE